MARDPERRDSLALSHTQTFGTESEPDGGGDETAPLVPSDMSRVDLTDTHQMSSPSDTGAALAIRHGAVFGQYELIRELDRGGMSTVFLARDVRLGRRVAIKFLGQSDPAWAARFLAEARATARCKHDNIVDIYDVGEAFGHPYMVLEYLEGVTLRAWLTERWATTTTERSGAAGDAIDERATAPVSPVRATELMIPVVRALAHAHEQGLVHRDLKPKNIMLVADGSIKVLDFGVVKAIGRKATTSVSAEEEVSQPQGGEYETRAGAVVGTLPYMSPEQWGAADIDQRSDLWAVGIMLWEMVTGKHPLHPLSPVRLQAVENLRVSMPSLSEKHPELGDFATIVDTCLAKRKSERIESAGALLGRLESVARGRGREAPEAGSSGAVSAAQISPFAGLSAFQESDAGRFFGRERDIASALVQLRSQPLVTVVGPSGAGKSSFIRAGVIPALKRSGKLWEVFVLRPGRHPLAAMAAILAQVARSRAEGAGDLPDVEARERYIDTLRAQPGYLGAALRGRARANRARLLLFVDQFEELYTQGATREQRVLFLDCLDGVADDASSPLRVMLSLRSDFLDRVAEDRAFTSEITRGLSLLPPMGRDELRQVLTRPLENVGYRLESEALVDHVLDSLAATRNPLPLLQFTATRLWDLRDVEQQLLTRASYEQLGGVAGALATHADATLSGMSASEQTLARLILSSLVTEERTRAIVSLSELRALGSDGDAVERVVHKLADARLLLIETEADQGCMVELSHESLIDRWPKIGQWLDEHQEDAQFLARVRASAREWHKQGRTEGLLWRGRAAEDGRQWYLRWRRRQAEQGKSAEGRGTALGARDRDYLEAVILHMERARRRRRRRIVIAFSFVCAVAVLVSLLAVRAGREAARAERQASRAEAQVAETARHAARADQLAADALSEALHARDATRMATARALQSDPTTVLALVREIESEEPPPGWAELAGWALRSSIAEAVLVHPGDVNNAVFSPDGRSLLTASSDGVARLFAAEGRAEPVEFRGHDASIDSAFFSADGQRVVTASSDKTARLWAVDGRSLRVLRGHDDRVYGASFSPDGQLVATASSDKTARLWRASDGIPIAVLRGHGDRVYGVDFSPDGRLLVTASGDRTARLWSVAGASETQVLRGHQHRVYSASFSPDGQWLATASGDHTARLWPIDSSQAPIVLSGHSDRVYAATFSADGARVATAAMDKTVRIWRADGSGRPLELRGHRDRVFSVRFSADGHRLISASGDRTARVWRTDGHQQPIVFSGHTERLYSASFSPDGRRIVTASADDTARVWASDGSGVPTVLRGHTDVVYSAVFGPDSARIATASGDGRIGLWDADGAGPPRFLRGHEDRVYGVSFSPDGAFLVSASGDETARIWRTRDGRQQRVLRGHDERVYSAVFSPDGTRVATASGDRTARVWRADGTDEALVLRGHDERVLWATFDREGRRLATASADRTVRIWNADGSGEALVLRGHEASVGIRGGGTFSPDGRRLVTHSDDKTIRVWDTSTGAQLLVLRGPDAPANSAAFRPDGRAILSAHGDNTAWLWRDLEPLADAGDRKLWSATTYCMPTALREKHLGVTAEAARANRARCLERMARSRAVAEP